MKNDEIIKENFKKFGGNIKKLRVERKISLKEMSDKTGIRKTYLQKIENGLAYGVLLERHITKIAEVLDVRISNLFNY